MIEGKSQITEKWLDGYKLEVDLTSNKYQSSWSYDLQLEEGDLLRDVYGAEATDNGSGNFTVRGNNGWSDIEAGETIKPIFIVDRLRTAADGGTQEKSLFKMSETVALEADKDDSTINVDLSYGGDIQSAIDAAKAGDTLRLGDSTYYTNGLSINKDITLDGSSETVIDGMGTNGTVIELGSDADGASIKDLTITNGNNGIVGDRAHNLTLSNLNVNNIGINNPVRSGNNNVGIGLSHADGLQLIDSTFDNIGRKAVGLGDTVGARIEGNTVSNINLAAQHAQSHDAAGIKLFNTHDVTIKGNQVSGINSMGIWNDTTNATTISGNTVTGVGEDFVAPDFNQNVTIHGIYNEKSSNSIVTDNAGSALPGFNLYNSTEFTTESMSLDGNDFGDSVAIGTTDYWVNESAEKAIATTVDPDAANFELFSSEYYEAAVI